MNLTCNWTEFALNAEYESYGMSRIAAEHNKTNARLTACRGTLEEIYNRLYAQGKKEETCTEMRIIQEALRQ